MRWIVWMFFALLFYPTAVLAARDPTLSPLGGIVSSVGGALFFFYLIFSAILIIIRNPFRGLARVLSFLFPYVLGFGLPIYIWLTWDLEGLLIGAVWIGSWVLAFLYLELHGKLFPEDTRRSEDQGH